MDAAIAKLSNRTIERAKAGSADKYIADGDGLFVRITPNGTKTFCFRYTLNKKRRLLSIGPVLILTIAEARDRASAARKLIFDGQDPLSSTLGDPDTQSETLSMVIEDWIERYAKRTYRRLHTQLQMVNKDILPVIGSLPIGEIGKKDISQVINKIIDRGSKVKANRVLSLMKTIFSYAAEHGHIDESPVTMTRKGAGGRERPKKRVLTHQEISSFFITLDNHAGFMTWRTKQILLLILITAQRPGEVAAMEWDHIDFEKKTWCLPADAVKSDRDHLVHLSQEALTVIASALQHTSGLRYVFQSVREEGAPTGTQTLSTALLRMFKSGEIGTMRRFTPHDLRRTAATRMADLPVHAHIVEKILNHSMKGVMAVYNYAEYMTERKAALEEWGRCVGTLTGQAQRISVT